MNTNYNILCSKDNKQYSIFSKKGQQIIKRANKQQHGVNDTFSYRGRIKDSIKDPDPIEEKINIKNT